MALLDSFLIMFEADTSKLDKGVKKSEKSADELVDTLKKADKEANNAGKSFGGMALRAAGAIATALASAQAISGVIGKAEDIAAIARTSEALGIAVEDVDAFGRAAVAMGGDAKGARDSITDMSETIGEALSDVESNRAKILTKLGVSLRDINGDAINGVEGLLTLAGAVEGLSREQATFNIKQLGITDNRTVEMVLKGRKELERLLKVQKDQGVITKETAEQARKFTDAMNILRGAMDSAGTGLSTVLMPALTVVIQGLTKLVNWIGDHKNIVVGFFSAIAVVVAAIYVPAMLSAAAATLAATWPIIAIAAVVTAAAAAFALIYDDIMAFVAGNDSLIGQIFEKYPMVKDIVMTVIDAFKFLGSVVGDIFGFLIDRGEAYIDFVAGIPAALSDSIDSIVGMFSAMGDGIMAVWDFIAAGIQAYIDMIMAGVDAVAKGITSVAEFFGLGESAPAGDVAAGQSAMMAASASPLNSVTSNSISNSVASSKREVNASIGEVTVVTQATDAGGIARDVSGTLDNQLRQLDAEFSSGVER